MLKLLMQKLIIKNYNLREKGLLPDEWYWVDKLYAQWYGDYSFYYFK